MADAEKFNMDATYGCQNLITNALFREVARKIILNTNS